MTTSVILPWPPKELSPNHKVMSKGGAMAKYRKEKEYKEVCWVLTKSAKVELPQTKRYKVNLRFYPPNRQTRDQDNMIASMKYGLDGFAAAIGVDDSRFDISIEVSDQLGGMVEVSIAG